MPTLKVFNPRRRRYPNPGASELFVVGNPQSMAKTTKRRRRSLKVNRRRRNPFLSSGKRRRSNYRRRRNPLEFKNDAVLALWASVGGIATRMGVQAFLSNYNSGVQGYAANAAMAVALGWLADKVNKTAGQGVLIGGLAATAMRMASSLIQKANPSSTQAAAMSGLAGDREFALSDFQSSYFFEPSVNTGPNQVVVPPPFAAYLPAAPAVAATTTTAAANGSRKGLSGYDPAFMGGIGGITVDRFMSRWS
jgi:hypothetical protein